MTQSLDRVRLQAITQRMVDILNGGSLALMTSLGHQAGLFELMAGRAPATSAELAAAGGLNERYVREWLGAMVVGGIVEYGPLGHTYLLPPEHAAVLTRAAGPRNLATRSQNLAIMATVEQQLLECFRNGGGVPYSAYGRFQEVMLQDSGQVYDALLVSTVLPLAAGLIERLTDGIVVADIGCGSGHAANLVAQAFPQSRVWGFDISAGGIATGRAEAERLGLTNVQFQIADVAALAHDHEFDLITAFDTIHDQAFPRRVLQAVAGALRSDGVFLMADVRASSKLEENISHPMGPYLYTASTMHCMAVSLAQGGEGLGTAWGEQLACELLAEAGFASVEVLRIKGDPANNYYIARKHPPSA